MSLLETATKYVPFIGEWSNIGLERSNSARAEKIASFVSRDIKVYESDIEWDCDDDVEFVVLRDGRKAVLQASKQALEVHISGTGEIDVNEHVRWDRTQKSVNRLEQWNSKNKAIMCYQSTPQTKPIPATLSRIQVADTFALMLGEIEEAMYFGSVVSKSVASPVRKTERVPV